MTLIILKALATISTLALFVISGERWFRRIHERSPAALFVSGLWVVFCGLLSAATLWQLFFNYPSEQRSFEDDVIWQLARGERNPLGFGIVAANHDTGVVFSVYCNRSFDYGGWAVSVRFIDTESGIESFAQVTGDAEPLYGTLRVFDVEISPNLSFSIPLQMATNTNRPIRRVFSSEWPGAGGRVVFEIIEALLEEREVLELSFQGINLINSIQGIGFSGLIAEEAVSQDCRLNSFD